MEQTLYSGWHHYCFRAMGSTISLWLEAEAAVVFRAFHSAETLFRTAEGTLSRFNPASCLSQLNARSGVWVEVPSLLWTNVERALSLAAETGGLFDPSLLNALERAGYDHSFEQMQMGCISISGKEGIE